MKINLNILFQKPEKTVKTMLTIEPLAPLSMVDTMPGSFYKTLAEPSKYHLSGAFENALGWHFGNTDRKEIRKHIETVYRKELNADLPDWSQSDVGFPPLLIHLFDVGMTCKPAMIFYKDLWKQMRKRKDWGHAAGTMNLDCELISEKLQLITSLDKREKGIPKNAFKQEKKEIRDEIQKALDTFFKDNIGSFPHYYTTVGHREYIAITEGVFRFHLTMTEGLYDALEKAFLENNLTYLGTNEGWVNLKIQKL